jgi:hypothetical protein
MTIRKLSKASQAVADKVVRQMKQLGLQTRGRLADNTFLRRQETTISTVCPNGEVMDKLVASLSKLDRGRQLGTDKVCVHVHWGPTCKDGREVGAPGKGYSSQPVCRRLGGKDNDYETCIHHLGGPGDIDC